MLAPRGEPIRPSPSRRRPPRQPCRAWVCGGTVGPSEGCIKTQRGPSKAIWKVSPESRPRNDMKETSLLTRIRTPLLHAMAEDIIVVSLSRVALNVFYKRPKSLRRAAKVFLHDSLLSDLLPPLQFCSRPNPQRRRDPTFSVNAQHYSSPGSEREQDEVDEEGQGHA